jgi:hypothetical protein
MVTKAIAGIKVNIMWLKRVFQLFEKKNKKEDNNMPVLTRERIAMHEAAHAIVWYLFKEKWNVNSLSIERENLPDATMNGALHIYPNFQREEMNIDRANEIFAISLAGLIGQNLGLLMQRPNIVIELMHVSHYNQILDETGCGGDYDIAGMYLPQLGNAFQTSEGAFARCRIFDLIQIFQDHPQVVNVHSRLTQLLLEKGTLMREELLNFFEEQNFQEYIEDENLDIIFFHRR